MIRVSTPRRLFFGNVTITVPADLFGEGENLLTDILTDEQKQNGLKKAEKLSNGSIKYTFKRSAYRSFIADLRKTIAESVDELLSDDTYQSVKKIKYNDNFSKFTVSVDRDEYENSFDTLITLVLVLESRIYQIFDVDAPQKVVIDIADNATGEIFETESYPEE